MNLFREDWFIFILSLSYWKLFFQNQFFMHHFHGVRLRNPTDQASFSYSVSSLIHFDIYRWLHHFICNFCSLSHQVSSWFTVKITKRDGWLDTNRFGWYPVEVNKQNPRYPYQIKRSGNPWPQCPSFFKKYALYNVGFLYAFKTVILFVQISWL